MKRIPLLISCLLIVLIMILTSCVQKDSPSTDPMPDESPKETASPSQTQSDVIIRLGMQFQEDSVMAVYQAAKEKFEADNPGAVIEFVLQERDLYDTIGLPTLLDGKNSPDIYFEWAGQRLIDRRAEGYLAPIPEMQGEWKEMFFESAFSGSTFDGVPHMVPQSTDISVMIWYNVKMFEELNISVPATWDEMLAACEKIKAAGKIPFAVGNKGFWPAGNWGGHIISRIVGEEAYSKALMGESDFNTPEFAKAMDYLKELGIKGYINDDMSALTDEEAGVLFYTGEAAMYPLGNWVVADMNANAEEDFLADYFNLPAITGGKGDQTSVMGVNTGHVINAKTQHHDLCVAFLKVFSSTENLISMAQQGYLPPAKGVVTTENADALMVKMMDETLAGTGTVVAPPDTGYNLEIANNLYEAIAKALTGQYDSTEVLASLDEANAHLR